VALTNNLFDGCVVNFFELAGYNLYSLSALNVSVRGTPSIRGRSDLLNFGHGAIYFAFRGTGPPENERRASGMARSLQAERTLAA